MLFGFGSHFSQYTYIPWNSKKINTLTHMHDLLFHPNMSHPNPNLRI